MSEEIKYRLECGHGDVRTVWLSGSLKECEDELDDRSKSHQFDIKKWRIVREESHLVWSGTEDAE